MNAENYLYFSDADGADATGEVALYHGTTERRVLTFPGGDKAPLSALILAPRDDNVLAIDEKGGVRLWAFNVPHPETTFTSLFGKVWYEGYPEPGYTWQSTSGTDSAEPKLSLVPLIFGTIKGAIYSLLFAVPIALLAAIYTAEFMHHRVRAVVKPVMELMASLPSVVIGFVVALVAKTSGLFSWHDLRCLAGYAGWSLVRTWLLWRRL